MSGPEVDPAAIARRTAVEAALIPDPPTWDIAITCPYCGTQMRANMLSPTRTPQEVRLTCHNRLCEQQVFIYFRPRR